MISFDKYLKKQLEDPVFRKHYREEEEMLQLSSRLRLRRTKLGKSQSDIARAARLSQQQLSCVENGDNCNILTYMKVVHALGLKLSVQTAGSHPMHRAVKAA